VNSLSEAEAERETAIPERARKEKERARLWRKLAFFCAGVLLIGLTVGAANGSVPRPGVVTGPQAPELERYAADRLCAYLASLFKIHVQPTTQIPAAADVLFLVGNSDSNPLVKQATRHQAFPKLSDQGIILRRARLGGTPALIVGGGSPRATLWAVYELVERWGVCYLLHGDVLPENSAAFTLPELNVVLEPALRVRQWRVVNAFPCGPESWGMADYRPVFDQLAKLKFNRILIGSWAHHPFLDYEVGGIARRTATIFFGFRYPVSIDTIGRRLFGGEPEFWNRDLPIKASYQELTRAGIQLIHNLMSYARQRGLQSVISAPIADFPPEFAPLIKGSQKIHQVGELTTVPGSETEVDDPGLNELAATVLRATVNTYPEVDYVLISGAEHRQWYKVYEQAWKALDAKYGVEKTCPLAEMLAAAPKRKGSGVDPERAVREVKGDITFLFFIDRLLRGQSVLKDSRRPDMKFIYDSLAEELAPAIPRMVPPGWESQHFLDYTPGRILDREAVLASLPTRQIPTTLIFTLHDDNVGLIPQTEIEPLAKLTRLLVRYGWAGFSTRYWLIGDHDPLVAFLSKAAWDPRVTAEAVAGNQFRMVCGEGCVEDLQTLLRELGAATKLLEWQGLGFSFPVPDMMMHHWSVEALPEYFVEVRGHYARALAAARRARTQARPEGRAYVDYWVGRLEFGIGYLDAVAGVKRAATAETAMQRGEALTQAISALQILRQAIEAFVRVARDRADVGAVAVLNEYAYRPLQAKVAELKSP